MERKILVAIVVSSTLGFVALLGITVLVCFWCLQKKTRNDEETASTKGILQDARKRNGLQSYKSQLKRTDFISGSRPESPAQTSNTTPLSTPRRPSGKDVAEARTIGISPSKSVEGEVPIVNSPGSDKSIVPGLPTNKNIQALKNAEHPSMAFWQNRSLSLVDMYIDNAEPSESCGQIQFSIEYDFEKNTLILKVMQAKDLPAMDLTGTSDPYVKVTLLPDKKHKLETKIKRRTLNPKWNETFYFEGFPIQKLQTRVLHLHVFDYDRFSKDDSIGEVFVPLCQIDLTSKPVYWRALKPPPKYKCGEVLISLCYHPANSLLTLTALKARNLKAKDINGKSDPYVKVWLHFGDKRVEKRKTPVFPCTLDPVFNETFTFHVPWEKIRDCSLDVRVMDFDNIGRNELIGRLCLASKNSSGTVETKHWQDMIAKPRQTVVQWHRLKPE